MLPTHTHTGATDWSDSPKHSLLAARRVNAWKGRRRLIFPALPALLLCVGILILGYEVWYATSQIKKASGGDGDAAGRRGSTHGLGGLIVGTRGGRRMGQHRAALPKSFPASHLHNLVLVTCHSVYTGLDFRNSEEESSWFLLNYQKVPGQTHSFVQHIQLGVEQAASDPNALLLFSGGKTRREAGPRAEGEGYWMVAEAAGWYGHKGVRERTFTEDHARDSFENLLFSLCRFYELTGRYPENVVVVGYEFKRERFIQLHRAAVGFPQHRFSFVGTPALNKGAFQGEAKTVAAFRTDPYGCSEELAAKRATRDPFSQGGPTTERCPALGELLDHCGPELYAGPLPWGGKEEEEPSNGGAASSRAERRQEGAEGGGTGAGGEGALRKES